MKSFRRSLALAITPVLVLSTVQATAATHQQVDVALEWFDVTAGSIAAAGAPTQVTNNRTWAIGWLAATRALLRTPPTSRPSDYRDAALAGAIHETLVTLIPARKTELDQSLTTALARIPDGPSESAGLTAGRKQAQTVLVSRANDGLDPASVNAPFTPPRPHPGSGNPLRRPSARQRSTGIAWRSPSCCAGPTSSAQARRPRSTPAATAAIWPRSALMVPSTAPPEPRPRPIRRPSGSARPTCSTPSRPGSRWQRPPANPWWSGRN